MGQTGRKTKRAGDPGTDSRTRDDGLVVFAAPEAPAPPSPEELIE